MRALIATRLSHFTDASTSIERQAEGATGYASFHGWSPVATTEDVDVSGAVSPWERADLGPWLTDPELIAQWDVLVVAKLDRLSRSIVDLHHMIEWCDAHGKTFVSVAESLDLSTATGRMVAKMIGLFAEWELARMSERQTDARKKLRAMGAWAGGVAPYGYDTQTDGSQHYLTVNDAQAEVIAYAVAMIIAGKSVRQTAHAMTAEGFAAPRGGKWNASTLGSMLRNPIIHGVLTHGGKPVLGDDGMPVRLAGACITDETWETLQGKLAAGSTRDGRTGHHNAALLAGVVRCFCGAPLYMGRRKNGYNLYRHADGVECSANSYTASHVESAAVSALLAAVGDVERTERQLVKGRGHGAQIKAVAASITELDKSFEAGDVPATAYGRMQARLETKLAEYTALNELVPVAERDDHWTDVPTGQTYAEYWQTLDDESRGQFLRDNGVSVRVSRGELPDVTDFAPIFAGGRGGYGNAVKIKRTWISTHLGQLETITRAAAAA
jgi:site-specific DNA recombinase